MGKLTHKDLVGIGYRWLKNRGSGLVLGEFVTSSREIPDVIGWTSGGRFSTLIECKVSRSDFLADKRKSFRHDGSGLGLLRFYLTEKGLLDPSELPDNWGLIETTGKRSRVIVDSGHHERSLRSENAILYSIARRIEIRGLLTEALAGQALELTKPTPKKGQE